MPAFAFKSWLLERAFRADFLDDAIEAAAFNPIARHLLASKLRQTFSLPPPVLTRGALFIHIPKNAGTSVSQALYGADVYHRSMRFYQLVAPEFAARAYKFAILREPTERFLSSFDFLMAGGGEEVVVHEKPLHRIRNVRSLDDYMDYLDGARRNWINIDNAARPQTWYIADHSGRIAVDELFTLATMAKVQEIVLKHGGGEIMHLNRTKRATHSVSDDQLRRLRKIYAADFSLYDFMKGRAPNAASGLLFA
jgi:hypothetical protein